MNNASDDALTSEIAALRHAFLVNGRLRVEFLGNLSKLLREHGIEVSAELLRKVELAIPDELRAMSPTEIDLLESRPPLAPSPIAPREEPSAPRPPVEPDKAPAPRPPVAPDEAPAPVNPDKAQ